MQVPSQDEVFERLNRAPFPTEVVAKEASHMAQRLQFVLDTPERRALFEQLRNNPDYRHDIALLGIIESNLDSSAISHSGAMGPLQDMGGLQGAFGDPDTIDHLARTDLLPQIDQPVYNQIISKLKQGIRMQRGTLLEFLIAERDGDTDFWQEFITKQQQKLTTPESAAQIADLYLDDLVSKAMNLLPINNDPLEALNFAVMSYNLGMGHLHTLRRLMTQNGIETFNTYTVLNFIDRSDFRQILRDHNLGRLHNNYQEAKSYLARYIALQEILHHNQLTTSDSTLG